MKNYIKIIIIFISIYIVNNNICYAEDNPCKPKNKCPENQRYSVDVCTEPPTPLTVSKQCLTVDEINKKSALIPSPRILPVCLEFDVPPQSVAVKGTTVFDRVSAEADLKKAADRWNCICDAIGECQCKIKVIFAGKRCEKFPELEGKVAAAEISYGRLQSGACQISCANTTIFINNSDLFMYGKNDPLPNEQPTNFFVTDGLAGNIGAVNSSGGKVYSFAETMMHELGHLFGFGHYNECGNPNDPNEIMNSHRDCATGPSQDLSDFDKCRFQAIYCPIGILEYQPPTQKVYPNPGENTVTVDFDLPKHTDNLKMSIMNPLGEVVLIPIENEVYNTGKHSVLINVDILPVGVYYIIIDAGVYRTAQPLTIIK